VFDLGDRTVDVAGIHETRGGGISKGSVLTFDTHRRGDLLKTKNIVSIVRTDPC
jgi:hypothetical protein